MSHARTGSLPHDLAGSLSPEQFKKWREERVCHCGKDGHALNSINCPVHGYEIKIKNTKSDGETKA